jgi:Tfp pilus assembly protein PilO
MRTLTPKQMLVTWMIGGLVCILVLGWLCFFSFAQRLRTNANDLLEAQVTIEANRRQEQNLSNLSKQVSEIQGHAEELNRAFVDRTKALAFVEYIESTAAKYNVEQAFAPVEPTRAAPQKLAQYTVEEKSFHLTLSGKTVDLFRFLAAVEQNPVYLLTTSVALTQNEQGTSTMTLEGTIPWH